VVAWVSNSDLVTRRQYLCAEISTAGIILLIMCVLHLQGYALDGATIACDLLGVSIFSAYMVYATRKLLFEWGAQIIHFDNGDYAFMVLCSYLDVVKLPFDLLSTLEKNS
jgi:ABC-type antimicrobial peptide transport system permease subunit